MAKSKSIMKQSKEALAMNKAKYDDDIERLEAMLKQKKKQRAEADEQLKMKEAMDYGEQFQDYVIRFNKKSVNVISVLDEVLKQLEAGKSVCIGMKTFLPVENTEEELDLEDEEDEQEIFGETGEV